MDEQEAPFYYKGWHCDEKAAKKRAAQRRNDLAFVMSKPEGRRFLADFLRDCGFGQEISLRMDAAIEANVGASLFARMFAANQARAIEIFASAMGKETITEDEGDE